MRKGVNLQPSSRTILTKNVDNLDQNNESWECGPNKCTNESKHPEVTAQIQENQLCPQKPITNFSSTVFILSHWASECGYFGAI